MCDNGTLIIEAAIFGHFLDNAAIEAVDQEYMTTDNTLLLSMCGRLVNDDIMTGQNFYFGTMTTGVQW